MRRSARNATVGCLLAGTLVGCAGGQATILPVLVGQDLQQARHAADAAGFTKVTAHDTMLGRSQDVDSNWQVCTQNPAPGPADPGAGIDLGVVRTEETCPGSTPTSSAATTSAAPTTSAEPTTQAPLRSRPPGRPAVVPTRRSLPAVNPPPVSTRAAPQPTAETPAPRSPEPVAEPSRNSPDPAPDEDTGSTGGPVVHSGAYCDPPGTGVTSKGTPMVCRPAKDGRDRWQKA